MPIQPPTPIGLNLSASFTPAGGYKVNAAWQPSSDQTVNNYEVGIWTTDRPDFIQTFTTPTTSFTFSAQPQQSYVIEVKANNFFGDTSANTQPQTIVPLTFLTTPVTFSPSAFTPSTNPSIPAAEAALIDTTYYLSHNPDVAAAGVDPGAHFVSNGWQEGRNPDVLFDVSYYLAHNPDVAAAHIDPLMQYALFGWKEGRDPSAHFSTSGYLAANPDIKLAGVDPLQHYLDFGAAEGRHLS